MTFIPPLLSFGAAAVMLSLAVLHSARGPHRAQKRLFVALSWLLAASQACQGVLLLQTTVDMGLFWLRVLTALTIFFPAVAAPFFLAFGKRDDVAILQRRMPVLFAFACAVGAAAMFVPARALVSEVHFADGALWGVTVTDWGKLLGVFVVLTNVLYLFMAENTYRAASLPEKVTLKYPMLGLVTTSVVTLVVVSRVLAISILDRDFLAVFSAGVIAMGVSLLFSTMRYRLFAVQVYIGRSVASSVVSVTVVGAYLVALSLVSYLARFLGVPYDVLTLQVLAVFAIFLIAAVLLSGRARRRMRRFIDQNFYLNRIDYRTEWRRFGHLMASSDRVDIYLANFISALCESLMAECGMVWIRAEGGLTRVYGLKAELQPALTAPCEGLGLEAGAVRQLAGRDLRFAGGELVCVVAALGSGDEVIGFVALGAKSMGLSYSEEDCDFIAMLADQATIVVENYQLEDAVIDARQLETFNRLASFVVHDLKNTVGMLSLTAENARERIGDAEFQKDAIDTIRRSVSKMQGLINSLRALDTDPALRKEQVEIGAIVERSLAPLKSVAQARGLSIDLAAPRAIMVDVDAAAIERVVDNLVYNALDASPSGGTVRVRVTAGDNGFCRVAIADGGNGFDAEFLKTRLYRPFQSTKREGLGLGLLMCKTMAAAHGGDIVIESELGRGATVTLVLPIGRS